MNYLIFLAGGSGTRMKSISIPKQYVLVENKPVFMYSLSTFDQCEAIDEIIFVASMEWRNLIKESIKEYNILKKYHFAEPGCSRQSSIYNALKVIKEQFSEDCGIIIHDAARPLVSQNLISQCLKLLEQYDGVMPVLQAKDTFYQSKDGIHIHNLLPRAELLAGQSPESFRFGVYYKLHNSLTEEDLNCITGSTELAFRNHLNICMIPGEETNFKITTDSDLQRFKIILREENSESISP